MQSSEVRELQNSGYGGGSRGKVRKALPPRGDRDYRDPGSCEQQPNATDLWIAAREDFDRGAIVPVREELTQAIARHGDVAEQQDRNQPDRAREPVGFLV